jgi:glycosyltransferase involved in cell wall biosynthesis
MKVLHVQKVGGIAGSENYLLEILPSLRKNGVDVEFLCLYNLESQKKNEIFISRLNKAGIAVHKIEVNNYPTFKALRQIRTLIENSNFDMVHTHLIHADFYLSLTKMLFGRNFKLVSTKHGYEEGYNNDFGFDPKFKKRDLYHWVCKFSENFINRSYAISDGLRSFFVATGIAKENKIDRIHYGFDFSAVTYDKSNQYRWSNKQLVIIGRLVKFKGHRYAFEALSILMNEHPDIKLIVVGSGSLEKELQELAALLNLSEQVIFVGYKSNIHDYMNNSDVVLIPSIAEGFGVVFLEGFNNQKPIVAFDVPAANEIIENGKSGILVKPYNIEKYAENISTLLKNPALAEDIANNGYNRLKEYFNLARMTEETKVFYQKVLHESNEQHF